MCEGAQNALHLHLRTLPQPAFPNSDHTPAGLPEFEDLALIAGLVAIQFLVPEFAVRLGPLWLAMRAAVPETTMHEYGHLSTNESNIRSARSLGVVQPVTPDALFGKCSTQRLLWAGVTAPDAAHQSACTLVLGNRCTAVAEIDRAHHGAKLPRLGPVNPSCSAVSLPRADQLLLPCRTVPWCT